MAFQLLKGEFLEASKSQWVRPENVNKNENVILEFHINTTTKTT